MRKNKNSLYSEPCIVFAKSNCYFNRLFCNAVGIKNIGDKLSFGFISSALNEYKFGIKITKNGPNYANYGKNRQLSCTVKTFLNQKGFIMSKSMTLRLEHVVKKGRAAWWFTLPKSIKSVKGIKRESK